MTAILYILIYLLLTIITTALLSYIMITDKDRYSEDDLFYAALFSLFVPISLIYAISYLLVRLLHKIGLYIEKRLK